MQPTRDLYDFFISAHRHFNDTLFEGNLAPCMLTVQRQKGCMGLFYPERWVTENGVKCHEVSLNPTYFGAYRVVELFQTLVHEQCHMWQQEYGRPSRAGYHNREWADKMESVGLMPSATGEPGGKRTGQCMSDFPLPRGRFLEAARAFTGRGEKLKWLDRFRTDDRRRPDPPLRDLENGDDADGLLTPVTSLFGGVETDMRPAMPGAARNKIKYTCGDCGCNVWGKPDLRVRCEDCDRSFEACS